MRLSLLGNPFVSVLCGRRGSEKVKTPAVVGGHFCLPTLRPCEEREARTHRGQCIESVIQMGRNRGRAPTYRSHRGGGRCRRRNDALPRSLDAILVERAFRSSKNNRGPQFHLHVRGAVLDWQVKITARVASGEDDLIASVPRKTSALRSECPACAPGWSGRHLSFSRLSRAERQVDPRRPGWRGG